MIAVKILESQKNNSVTEFINIGTHFVEILKSSTFALKDCVSKCLKPLAEKNKAFA